MSNTKVTTPVFTQIMSPSVKIVFANGSSTDVTASVRFLEIDKDSHDYASVYRLQCALPLNTINTPTFFLNIKYISVAIPIFDFAGNLFDVFQDNLVVSQYTIVPLTRAPTDPAVLQTPEFQYVDFMCRPQAVKTYLQQTSKSYSGPLNNAIQFVASPLTIGYISPSTNSQTVSFFLPNQTLVSMVNYCISQGVYKSDVFAILDVYKGKEQLFVYSLDDSIRNPQMTIHFWDPISPQSKTDATAISVIPNVATNPWSVSLPNSAYQSYMSDSVLSLNNNIQPQPETVLGNQATLSSELGTGAFVTTNPNAGSMMYSKVLLSGITLWARFRGQPQVFNLRPGQCVNFKTTNVQYSLYNGSYIVDTVSTTVDLDKTMYFYSALKLKRFGPSGQA